MKAKLSVMVGLVFSLAMAAAVADMPPRPGDPKPKPIKGMSHTRWPKAYQATFKTTSERNTPGNIYGDRPDKKPPSDPPKEFKQYSNGKGLVRVDDKDGEATWITDYSKGQENYITHRSKTFSVSGGAHLNAFDATSALDSGFEPIGAKTVKGHPCHGFKSSGGGASTWYVSEIWYGDDTDCIVSSSTKTRMENSTTELASYKPGVPPASMFEPPVGYKSSH
ncbi:MAG: hypothetical protein K2Q33_05195 [Gammaproteobacteria bacterium]|nr:hypothetical protein [Gammaproteobacteria bacterium]